MRLSLYLASLIASSALLFSGIPKILAVAAQETVEDDTRPEGSSFDRASALLQRALLLHRELGDIDGEAAVLAQFGELLAQQGQPELAIVFYKQSINIIEDIRSSLSGLPPEFQQSFTGTVAETYRTLADLLLQADRVLEAQQVLDLLRVQELEDYLGDVRGNLETADGVDYQRAEQEIITRYQRETETAIELIEELNQLSALNAEELTPEQESRREDLIELRKQLAVQFNDFISSEDIRVLSEKLRSQENGEPVNIEDLASLQDNLADIDAALFYPLILDDRIELVITTANAPPLRRTVEGVDRVKLNRAIAEFRQALQDPTSDAIAPAQQLYQWLIKPIETDLTAAGVETIVYSPDGALRYIPLAALHDGEQWMAERFRINNITAQSLTNLDTVPQKEPKILAGAFADKNITYPIQGNSYRGLPFAGQEVEFLDKTLPTITSLFDNDFTLKAVTNEIDRVNILHFATHAAFVPGDP